MANMSSFLVRGHTVSLSEPRVSVARAREHVNDGSNSDEVENIPPE